MKTNPKIIVIGIGNEFRRDDSVGVIVAREVAKLNFPDVKVIEQSGEGAALMEVWKETELAIMIDAVSSDNMPGTVHRLEPKNETIPSNFFNYSTHAFSIAEAIELAKALKSETPDLVIYGVDGADFGSGEGLSEEVEKKVQDVLIMVIHDILKYRQIKKGSLNLR
ncbi:hydrogenase maturation protease [bacterium]|nr:hydrogenase maturation protease [bacterium]